MVPKELMAGLYKWPESIDFDRRGNLYFADVVLKALFQRRRNQDGTLAGEGIPLLYGFSDASGVSIDRENDLLYLGVNVNKGGKILRIPLRLFETCTGIDYRSFRWESLGDLSLRPQELDIEFKGSERRPVRTNGIVLNGRTGTVYFTNTSIPGSYFGRKGFVGSTRDLFQRQLFTPNGIDVDPISENALVISLLRRNQILHLDLTDGRETPSPQFGSWLDGLLCLENGDVLVASFMSGEIYHLFRKGNQFVDPWVIADLPGCPTDMAIGQSSDGKGESLFVTTTSGVIKHLWKGGRVEEIHNIRELIQSRYAARGRATG